jgi:ferric-dicitrate binding protein FerR (iron transport regulator)
MSYRGDCGCLGATRHHWHTKFGLIVIQIGIQIGKLTNPVIVNNAPGRHPSDDGRDSKKGRRSRLPRWRHYALLSGIAAWALHAYLPGGARSTQYFSSDVDRPRHVALEDGSQLDLRADSLVAVDYLHSGVQIGLVQGEGLFNIVHNASRPVDVIAGAALIQVLGTQFDVSLLRDGTKLIVMDGTVQVSRLRPNWSAITDVDNDVRITGVKVHMGETAKIALNTVQPMFVQQIDPGETRSAVSWNVRHFHETPIDEVVAELNRNNVQPKIIVLESSIGAAKITGQVAMNDPQAFANSVPDFAPYAVVSATLDGKILLTHRADDSH